MSAPLVSTIIPCYNAERWVAATLESALAQTWPNQEIILVNDGSRDGSLAVAKQFESLGVRVIDQPNRGASAARNAGLRAARGEYVQFLDADDLLAPDKIERQLKRLSPMGSRVLSSSQWARFRTAPEQAEFLPAPNHRDLSGVEFQQLHWEEGCMMQPGAWLTPRTLCDAVGGWDESLSLNDDGEYFARVMLAADRIVFCPAARTWYRSHAGEQLSGRRDLRALESFFRSVELTTGYLLAADRSARSVAAVAHAWKWAAFELYPEAPSLARQAEFSSFQFGGSERPFPAGKKFALAARFLGWRMAKRLRGWFVAGCRRMQGACVGQ